MAKCRFFPLFALLACWLAMRALIHPLEPACLVLGVAGGGFGVARGFQQASPLLGASGGPGALRAGGLAPKRCMNLN